MTEENSSNTLRNKDDQMSPELNMNLLLEN